MRKVSHEDMNPKVMRARKSEPSNIKNCRISFVKEENRSKKQTKQSNLNNRSTVNDQCKQHNEHTTISAWLQARAKKEEQLVEKIQQTEVKQHIKNSGPNIIIETSEDRKRDIWPQS